MEFEVGEIVIHRHDGRHGRVINLRQVKAVMAEVRWKDLSTSWLPIDMIRKKDNLPTPTMRPTPRPFRRGPISAWRELKLTKEADRILASAAKRQKG